MRLIDADAAIDAFNTDVDELIVAGKGNAEAVEKYLNGVISMIKALPSAQPEQKAGRWIRGDQEKLTGSQRCSVCGKSCYRDREYFNFCPHCGAYMRGERNEP